MLEGTLASAISASLSNPRSASCSATKESSSKTPLLPPISEILQVYKKICILGSTLGSGDNDCKKMYFKSQLHRLEHQISFQGLLSLFLLCHSFFFCWQILNPDYLGTHRTILVVPRQSKNDVLAVIFPLKIDEVNVNT